MDLEYPVDHRKSARIFQLRTLLNFDGCKRRYVRCK